MVHVVVVECLVFDSKLAIFPLTFDCSNKLDHCRIVC
jgi:hypothetical protein